MNPKFAITPEMVRSAYDAVPDKLLFKSTVEAMLDAALNPPSEPEVTVTDEMKAAGRREALVPGASLTYDRMEAIYRAMRKLEPK